MSIKQFSTVEEWLKSNPSKETTEKVLKVINKSVISENRKIYYQKRSELNKMENAVKSMKKVDLPITDEITTKIKELSKEVENLQKQLPTSNRSNKSNNKESSKEVKKG